jgi:glycosyltransferase involved in cell wall biosynthesis
MFALMSGASALLFPSYEEGFGLPALEARALGVQVICSPIPALRDTVAGRCDDAGNGRPAALSRCGVGKSVCPRRGIIT